MLKGANGWNRFGFFSVFILLVMWIGHDLTMGFKLFISCILPSIRWALLFNFMRHANRHNLRFVVLKLTTKVIIT